MRSELSVAFQKLSYPKQQRLLIGLIELLDGAEWNADMWQEVGLLFGRYGIEFKGPEEVQMLQDRPWLNEAEKELIAALRGEGYKQTQSRLRSEDAFCCLGVACDIAPGMRDHWVQSKRGYYILGHTDYLPEEVQKRLGWSSMRGLTVILDRSECNVTLSELNDNGLTFAQIADVIEAGLVERAKEAA